MKLHITIMLCFFLTALAAPELYPSLNSQYTGVVDRFEGDAAVILLEEIGEEIILPVQSLGAFIEENQWVLVHVKEGKPVMIRSLPRVNEERQTEISDLLDRLHIKNSTVN